MRWKSGTGKQIAKKWPEIGKISQISGLKGGTVENSFRIDDDILQIFLFQTFEQQKSRFFNHLKLS